MGVFMYAGNIPVTAELVADSTLRNLSFGFDVREMELDDLYGPGSRHHPNRSDWWHATRPDRVRANILANLPPGRPGRFQKAPNP